MTPTTPQDNATDRTAARGITYGVCRAIAERREAAGLFRNELAARAGIDALRLHNIELGTETITLIEAVQLSAALNTDLVALLLRATEQE